MAERVNHKGELTELILKMLATGAVLSAALLFPGLGIAWQKYKQLQKYDKWQVRQTLKRLHKQKIIKVAERGESTIIELTENGKKRVLEYQIVNLQIKKPKKWDGFWRIVIFDIPESKKLARETFRNKLKQLGFVNIQKSVFVTPYPCEDEIKVMASNYQIEPQVIFITAKSIQPEEKLLKHFKLI